ncbi:hypothetical protein Bbelb_192780 [Branchiostoma belcheri]|nr:hypothetical protein Bbelb_192780 [Branchiostoma belcheri]
MSLQAEKTPPPQFDLQDDDEWEDEDISVSVGDPFEETITSADEDLFTKMMMAQGILMEHDRPDIIRWKTIDNALTTEKNRDWQGSKTSIILATPSVNVLLTHQSEGILINFLPPGIHTELISNIGEQSEGKAYVLAFDGRLVQYNTGEVDLAGREVGQPTAKERHKMEEKEQDLCKTARSMLERWDAEEGSLAMKSLGTYEADAGVAVTVVVSLMGDRTVKRLVTGLTKSFSIEGHLYNKHRHASIASFAREAVSSASSSPATCTLTEFGARLSRLQKTTCLRNQALREPPRREGGQQRQPEQGGVEHIQPPDPQNNVAPQGQQDAPQGQQDAPQGQQDAPQGQQDAPQGQQEAPQGQQATLQGQLAARQEQAGHKLQRTRSRGRR